jgi:hypothetical protein
MSNNKPAFPQPDFVTDGSTEIQGDPGMALRDYFAAKAMQALIPIKGERPMQMAAQYAYDWADAMMEVRNAAQ